ncbi:MAG: hypothetical protein ACKPKG_12890 [Dolichospermum sp.]
MLPETTNSLSYSNSSMIFSLLEVYYLYYITDNAINYRGEIDAYMLRLARLREQCYQEAGANPSPMKPRQTHLNSVTHTQQGFKFLDTKLNNA